MSTTNRDLVPLLRLRGISEEQLTDLRKCFRENGIRFKEDPPSSPIHQFLYVSADEFAQARIVVKAEFSAFADSQRKKWKVEWEQQHQGSYFRWLKHQFVTRPKEAAFRFLNLL